MEKSKAMARGRRLAYLRRCLMAQELLQKYENESSVRKRLFEQYVKPVLHCSYATFNNMLNVLNPSKEINLLTSKN
jgi:hypothetical protein